MDALFSLGLTFILGLFLVLGACIVFMTKNSDRFVHFSLSIAFGVMVMLLVTDLFPESIEMIQSEYSWNIAITMVVVGVLIGFILLKLLDYFVPDHHLEEHHDEKENLFHIGLVSSIALVLHNVIEGMAIYGSVASSWKLGLLVSIGVGLHNIPMGMVIASTFYRSNHRQGKTLLICFLIGTSTFLGGLLMFCFSRVMVSDLILGLLLAVTAGMILYLVWLELFPHLRHYPDKKITVGGVALGVGLILLSLLF